MAILGVPMENGLGKTTGTAEAPERVMQELRELAERSLTESGNPPDTGMEMLNLDLSNLNEASQRIEETCTRMLDTGRRPVALGGDHSLSYASVRAFVKKHPGAGIIVFDAHPDLMHAMNPPTHEDWLLTLLSEDVIQPSQIYLLGIRSIHPSELKRLRGLRIKHMTMREMSREGLPEVTDTVMAYARTWPALYISVDIDVLDPAFAPGTGYPEPGGMSTRELLYCLGRFMLLQNFRMADLVEVNPRLDSHDLTAKAAARILAELNDNSRVLIEGKDL